MSPRTTTTLMFSLLTAGCDVSAPVTPGQQYAASMGPLLQDNAALARDFLDLAGAVKRDEAKPSDIAARIESDMLPAAASLARRSGEVELGDPQLAAVHADLVSAWAGRVTVYTEVHTAWTSDDLEGLEAATQLNLSNKADELAAFEAINDSLVAHGARIDPYPAAPPAPSRPAAD